MEEDQEVFTESQDWSLCVDKGFPDTLSLHEHVTLRWFPVD